MTEWESQSDSEESDLSAREGLGNLPPHKGNVGGPGGDGLDWGRGECRAGATCEGRSLGAGGCWAPTARGLSCWLQALDTLQKLSSALPAGEAGLTLLVAFKPLCRTPHSA